MDTESEDMALVHASINLNHSILYYTSLRPCGLLRAVRANIVTT